ncbi:MAG: adenine deaminase [Candidatus Bathyarchaeia archaeon]
METLIDASLGLLPLDVLIFGQVVDVYRGVIFDGYIGVKGGLIVYVGSRPKPSLERIDASENYILPAYIDGHIHVESTLMTPSAFAKAVIPRGTCCVIADPHEIANVLGLEGIKFMIEDSTRTPLKLYFMIPSSVPSTKLETSGAEIGLKEIRVLKGFKRVLGLGEVMNYLGVIGKDKDTLDKIRVCHGMVIDGHAPGLRGEMLCAYILAGIGSDHEVLDAEEASEKLSLGMWVMIREGSTAKSIARLKGVISKGCPERVMLVTDDRHADDIVAEGHIDHCLRRAVEEGIDPVDAVKMVTLKPSEYFGLRTLGGISPGKSADIVIVDNLRNFNAKFVLIDGKLAARDGKYLYAAEVLRRDIRLGRVNVGDISTRDLQIRHPNIKYGTVKVRVIGLVEGQIFTEEEHHEVSVIDGAARPNLDKDILKICVVERHRGSGRIGLGFVRGFGLKSGAIASTVAHDSHNIIAVGVGDGDIYTAILRLRDMNGGFVVVDGGRVISELPLPVAGLMSNLDAEEISAKIRDLRETTNRLGCRIKDPFMALSFLSLPVIPKLKITDYGLIDSERLVVVSPFLD